MNRFLMLFLAGFLAGVAAIGGSGSLLAQDCQTLIDELDARLGTSVNLDGEVATGAAAGLDSEMGDLANGSLLENAGAERLDPDSAPVNWRLAIVILVAMAVALVPAGKGIIALRRGRVRKGGAAVYVAISTALMALGVVLYLVNFGRLSVPAIEKLGGLSIAAYLLLALSGLVAILVLLPRRVSHRSR